LPKKEKSYIVENKWVAKHPKKMKFFFNRSLFRPKMVKRSWRGGCFCPAATSFNFYNTDIQVGAFQYFWIIPEMVGRKVRVFGDKKVINRS